MLILPIEKKWYDMVLSGEKKEEYREVKPYWNIRFGNIFLFVQTGEPSGFDKQKIMFRNGYGKNAPSFIADCTLYVGTGKKEWGAEPGKMYYVLRIDRIYKEGGI